jgi:hypothetical protein
MPLPARWFHLQSGAQRGPVDLAEIRALVLSGEVAPDTYVWADGMPDWMAARRVPALVPPSPLRPDGWRDTGHSGDADD